MSKVKFSDVVVRANTKEDRHNTNLEFYVGGEHIDTDEVVIEKRGLIAGSTIGPMFYFGFKAGQVLFVSRNPHLRKAGMVTFDGICSEKTFVLETKDESVLLQRYLPFILQSDHFWSYAEAHKSGSVNFFINWSTLANYEFELPSIQKQQELADVLWAMTETRLSYKRLISVTDEIVISRFHEMFGNITARETLENLSIKGPQNGFYRKDDGSAPNMRIVKMKELFANECISNEKTFDMVNMTPDEQQRFCLTKSDLLFGRRSLVVEGAGKCRRVGNITTPLAFESSLLRVTLDTSKVLPLYVQKWFDTDEGNHSIESIRSVTTIAGIKPELFTGIHQNENSLLNC